MPRSGQRSLGAKKPRSWWRQARRQACPSSTLSAPPASFWRDKASAASDGDGVATFVTHGGRKSVTPFRKTVPSHWSYLYFDINDALPGGDPLGRVYVSVEFFDDTSLGRLGLEYDSATGDHLEAKYRVPEAAFGNRFLGTRTWRTATFLLREALFANRQNNGADFRLTIWDHHPSKQAPNRFPLFVREVRFSRTPPVGGVLETP